MPLPNVSTNDPHVSAHNAERAALNTHEQQLAGKITAPPNPSTGDVLRWNGSAWAVSAVRLFEGIGSPQGQIAAPLGSQYRDTAATRGAVFWIKTAGEATSNTGWLLVAGDTGWRNVAGMLSMRTGGAGHVAQLRRVNDVVDLYLDLTMPNSTASPLNALVLPVGFRPHVTRHGAMQDNKEGAAVSTAVGSDGVVAFYTLSANKRDRFNGTWTTQDAWPASLPGS